MIGGLVACEPHPENGPGPNVTTLVLGDSYSSGNGVMGVDTTTYFDKSADDPRPQSQYRFKLPGADTMGCMRAHEAYGESLYRLLSSVGKFMNGACNGDTTANILAASPPEAQTAGFTDAQQNQVSLILLSIGGNDLGFASIMQHCFIGFSNNATNCQNQFNSAFNMLLPDASGTSELYRRIHSALAGLAAQFTNAKIVLVGYPQMWEGDFTLTDATTSLNPTQLLRVGLADLNRQQAEVVDELDAGTWDGRFAFMQLHVPDDEDPDTIGEGFFDGHGINGPAADWINPHGTAAQLANREEWLHPNIAGHAAIAQHLTDVSVVKQLVRQAYPKMSLTKVDGQWFALDNTAKLWTVTADFVRCQLPNGPYKLVSWRDPQQVFDAATNSAPYPALPGQPGCSLSVPRAGDILDGSLGTGQTPYDAENSWVVSFGPNGEKLRSRIWWHDGDPNHVASADCFAGRGARVITVSQQTLNEYQDTGQVVYDDKCWWGAGAAFDEQGTMWLNRNWPLQQPGSTWTPITEDWMRQCLDTIGNFSGSTASSNGPFTDLQKEQARQAGLLNYKGYADARCVTP
jgi:lysophospholipase L1-like esterase